MGRLIPFLWVLGLWAFGFPALEQYNTTWDEALGDYFFGERYLSYFTSLDPAYLEFDADPYPEDRTPDLGISPFRNRPWEYYPVANILAAATSDLLSRRLGWLDAFDGFHALNLLLTAPLVFALFHFLWPRFGLVTATASLGFLFTAPRIVCHWMANIKDFPLMIFFTLTCFAFLVAYEAGSRRGLVAAGGLWGLSLGVKANALFLPGIVAAVVLLARPPTPWQNRRPALFSSLFGAGLLGATVLVASWPYLWADPLGRLWQHLEYIGFRSNYTRPESLAPVFEAVLLTTPIPFLLFAAIGLVPCGLRAVRREPTAILLLAWVAVVLGRYLLPQAVNFDGVRHFLELFPALAALAGLGLAWTGQRLATLVSLRLRKPLKVLWTLCWLLPSSWATLASHPFQIAWWNSLAGGPAGAYARDLPQAGDYWGMSYRHGIRWLNENAPPGSLLAVPVIEHAVRLVAQERLRDDIVLLPITSPLSPRIPPERLQKTVEASLDRPLYVMFVERRDWMNALMADCLQRLEPEVVWELDGAPILRIYRYQPAFRPPPVDEDTNPPKADLSPR